jgi:hypothetical protein
MASPGGSSAPESAAQTGPARVADAVPAHQAQHHHPRPAAAARIRRRTPARAGPSRWGPCAVDPRTGRRHVRRPEIGRFVDDCAHFHRDGASVRSVTGAAIGRGVRWDWGAAGPRTREDACRGSADRVARLGLWRLLSRFLPTPPTPGCPWKLWRAGRKRVIPPRADTEAVSGLVWLRLVYPLSPRRRHRCPLTSGR